MIRSLAARLPKRSLAHFQMELIEPIDSKRRPRELDVQHQIGRVRALLRGFTAEKSGLLCFRPLHRFFLRIDVRSSSDDLLPVSIAVV